MARKSISDEQRRALRVWFRAQHPRPRQIDAVRWFEERYHHRITQSTISESLSSRFAYLENVPAKASTSSYRQRQAQWPLLEAILFEWYQFIDKQNAIITGDIILRKAQQIWPQIPQYRDKQPPSFSLGWLAGFKKRHGIKERSKHGEAASVAETAEIEMRAIQTLCGEYEEADIFNMDETGLFWKQAPSKGLSTTNRPGVKKDKSRISIICCTNFTGTERMPLWLIGKSQKPRALKNVNSTALGFVWRANAKAWNNTMLMAEWLRSFYSTIDSNRTVLLLMDNFSAHIAGVELAPPPSNIRIQWLPANSTSLYQPLDQGIINNLKHNYKKYWIDFMIEQYEQQRDPQRAINLSFTVRWITRAWFLKVSNDTVYRCFRKAKIQPQQQPISLPSEPALDLSSQWSYLQRVGNIRAEMSLGDFLNPEDENMTPQEANQGVEELDLEAVIQHHTGQLIQDQEEAIDEDQGEEVPPPAASEALEAIQLLVRFSERSESSTPEDIRYLERLERSIDLILASTRRQSTLEEWIT